MDSGILIGIISLIITVAISLLLFKLQRVMRYPAKLNYSILRLSKVMGGLPDSYKDISLRYQDYTVGDNLYYIKGVLFNDRSCDVQCNEGDEGAIQFCLPKDARWLDVHVNKSDNCVSGEFKLSESSPRTASICFPLLKKDEAIIWEGLFESSSVHSFEDEDIMTLNHRIKDLDKINQVPFVSKNRCERRRKLLKLQLYPLLLLGVAVGMSVYLYSFSPLRFKKSFDDKSYSASITKNGEILVTQYSPSSLFNKQHIDIDQFERDYSISYKYEKTLFEKIMILLYVIAFCIFSIRLIIDYVEYKRDKKLSDYLLHIDNQDNKV